jgi:transcriptional regulator with XRE-family HTH domain
MSDPNTLGSLVRKRRLESGYSLGQLASKVGKTAAEVRAWERDSELPEHGIIERLASTLEIDLGEIKKRLDAGRKALEAERKAAAEKAAKAEAADAAKAGQQAAEEEQASADPVIFPEKEVAPEPSPTATEAEPEPEEEEDLPGFVVKDPFTPPPPIAEEAPEEPVVAVEPDRHLLDAPTEPVPVPVITDTAAAARASRAAAVLEEPPPPVPQYDPSDQEAGLLRYLEPLKVLFDPHQRYLYWIRAGLTVIVLLVFMVILLAQVGNLLDAIGELLDTIKPVATDPNDINALGWIGLL